MFVNDHDLSMSFDCCRFLFASMLVSLPLSAYVFVVLVASECRRTVYITISFSVFDIFCCFLCFARLPFLFFSLFVSGLFVGRLLVDCVVSVLLFIFYGFWCFPVAAVLGSFVV